MPQYIRSWVPGGTYFFTLATLSRRRIFSRPESRRILVKAVTKVRRDYPLSLDAWVLMPDHLHTIWTLTGKDANYGKIIGLIKANFSKAVKTWLHDESMMNP